MGAVIFGTLLNGGIDEATPVTLRGRSPPKSFRHRTLSTTIVGVICHTHNRYNVLRIEIIVMTAEKWLTANTMGVIVNCQREYQTKVVQTVIIIQNSICFTNLKLDDIAK